MNEETFERIDRWMGEEAKLLRLSEERRKAAARKAQIAKERGWEPNDRRLLFVLIKNDPDEAKIIRGSEGCTCTILYTREMIEDVATNRPWLLAELMAELNQP